MFFLGESARGGWMDLLVATGSPSWGNALERDEVAMPVTSMPVASVQTGVPMSDDSLVPAKIKE